MKKFLFVLCLALLLTLVCASALAVEYKTPNGTLLSDVTKINGKDVKNPGPNGFNIIVTPDCYNRGTASFTMTDNSIETVTIDFAHDLEIRTLDGRAATCNENGQGKYFCKKCNAEDPYNQGIVNISKNGHKWEYVVDKAETCSKEGMKHRKCSICGEDEIDTGTKKIKYVTIPKHGWSAGDWVVEKAQTCKEGGLRYLVCSKCGEPQRVTQGDLTSEIKYDTGAYKNPSAHTFGDWVIKIPAGCKDGLKARYCSVCNLEETQVIVGDPTKHDWENKYSVTANCSADGTGKAKPADKTAGEITGTKTCKNCGTTEAIPVAQLPNNYMDHHHFVADPNGSNKPAGCVGGANGTKALVCTSCGGKYTQSIPAATSHNFGAWTMTVAPGKDGTKNGVWERYCMNYNCVEKEVYVGTTAPSGAAPVPTATANATTAPTTAPTGAPSGSENYQVTSWSFTGSGVSGQVKGNVTYRTPGLGVNVIIYTPTGTFLATSTPVNEDGTFSVSAGGAVYAVSIQLKDNTKTYQTDGKYV